MSQPFVALSPSSVRIIEVDYIPPLTTVASGSSSTDSSSAEPPPADVLQFFYNGVRITNGEVVDTGDWPGGVTPDLTVSLENHTGLDLEFGPVSWMLSPEDGWIPGQVFPNTIMGGPGVQIGFIHSVGGVTEVPDRFSMDAFVVWGGGQPGVFGFTLVGRITP